MAELLKVLVVDDEAGMRSGVSRVLEDYSLHLPEVETDIEFEAIEAETAEQGLELIELHKPHILLLDYKLPGMSGLELLGKIEEKKIDILTVMITAYASLETAIEATKKGAYDFLAKPFSPAELKHLLRRASGRIIFKRQAQKLAEEKRKVRFQFISVLAHELKSPLAAIQGYLNIVKDRVLGDDINAYDSVVERSLVRVEGMGKLIFDLLDLTRIESQQKKREFAGINLRKMAEKSIETISLSAQQRHISINLNVEDNLAMDADAGEIEIIMNNLISNAVKYNKDNGRVDINIQSAQDAVVISVADTGIGLTEKEAGKLFNDFVRIRNKKTQNILGSGLGLSVVKKLANLYDGQVFVKSKPDIGTTFTVRLKKVNGRD